MTSQRQPAQLLRATLSRIRLWLGGVPLWLTAASIWVATRAMRRQVRTLHLPILGEHRWRESATYSVAYNFVHGSFDFFHPRIDFNCGKTGIMGMEAPVVPFLVALAMRVFGDAPAVARTVIWAMSSLGLLACLALVYRLRGAALALGFLVAFMLSPMALVELRQIQPDGATAMLAAVSAFFFYRYACLEKRRDYVLGIAAFTVTVSAKGPAIVLTPAIWWFSCAARRISSRQYALRALPFIVPAIFYLAWDGWEHHLSDVYNGGWSRFSVDFTLPQVWKYLKEASNRRHIFWFLYPCYVANWVLFPAFVVGLAAAFQARTKRVSVAFLGWLLLGSFFLASFSDRLRDNWYYADLVLVPVTYFVGSGLAEVYRLFARGPLPGQSLVGRWAALVVLGTLALARLLTAGVDKLGDVVGASGPRTDNSWMSDWHLTTLLLGLSFAMVLATQGSKRLLRVTAFVLLPFAAYCGVGRGQSDALQALSWRSRLNDERTYDRQWLDALRPLVNRYSTRDDLFVVDETDLDDPYWLHLPLRKGWGINTDDLSVANIAYCQHRGARFFLTYHERPPPEEMHLPLLGSTEYFHLYCLDPNGCSQLH